MGKLPDKNVLLENDSVRIGMSEVFKKLNLKDQSEIVVLNAPESFEGELALLDSVTVHREIGNPKQDGFVLVFVKNQADVDTLSRSLVKSVKGDALLWFAYPKTTSKKYACDFNRDTGWDTLTQLGFKGVRQVSIDQDWSALGFRRLEYGKRKS